MTKNFIKWMPWLFLAGVVVLLARALFLNPTALPLEKLGQPLPQFRLPLLADSQHFLTNQQLDKKPMLIHLWATWCGVCRYEHKVLLKLHQVGVPIIGINYMDDPAQAKSWLSKEGDPFLYSMSDLSGKYGLQLGAYGTPETYLIDGQGKLRYRYVGGLQASDVANIQTLLKEIS